MLKKTFIVEGNDNYLRLMSTRFEPSTIQLMKSFCSNASNAIDVGANIGLTTLALAEICSEGKIIAIEPVPQTFNFLRNNIANSGLKNIITQHFAAGNKSGDIQMYGNNDFLAGAFVGDQLASSPEGHFSVNIPLKKIDDAFPDFGITQLDFIKLDVEGYEISALQGAKNTLQQFKPVVMMEMNHWCLNMLQNMTLPQFRTHLFELFPYVFAVDKTIYCDLSDDSEFYETAHAHLTHFKFMNIVAGFDKENITNALKNNQYIAFKDASATQRKILHKRFNIDFSSPFELIRKILTLIRA